MINKVSVGAIAAKVLEIRGRKVMLDRDLAYLYGVSTKALNQAVKRNIMRFPGDFMFKLAKTEKNELVTTCDRFNTMKHSTVLPYVFTEQGIAMLSSVLNSERAVQVNIQIMRAFVKLRYILSANKQFAMKLRELEDKLNIHDKDISDIFEAIRQLMGLPVAGRRVAGFSVK